MFSGKYIHVINTLGQEQKYKLYMFNSMINLDYPCLYYNYGNFPETVVILITETKSIRTDSGTTYVDYYRKIDRVSGMQLYKLTDGTCTLYAGSGEGTASTRNVMIPASEYNSGPTNIYINGTLCGSVPLSSKKICLNTTVKQEGTNTSITYIRPETLWAYTSDLPGDNNQLSVYFGGKHLYVSKYNPDEG